MSISSVLGKLADLREPLLGPNTRDANRALLVTALLLVLMSLQLANPNQIPGLPIDVVASRSVVTGGLVFAQIAFLAMFIVNVVADIQRVLLVEARSARDEALRRYEHELRRIKEEGLLHEFAKQRFKSDQEKFDHELSMQRRLVERIAAEMLELQSHGESGSRFSAHAAEMRIQMDRLRDAQNRLMALEQVDPSKRAPSIGQVEALANDFLARSDESRELEEKVVRHRGFVLARKVQSVIDILLGPLLTLVSWIICVTSHV